MADKRLSEMPEINEFSSSAKVYGIAPGVDAGAFTQNAFLDLIYKSEAGLNKFTTAVEPTRVGNVITYPAGIGWLIQGVAKTNAVNNVVTIPYAATGKSRIDLIVATSGNQFVRVPGVEVTDPNVLASPVIPVNTLLASTILVGDASVDYASDPAAPVYVGMALSQQDFIGAVPRAFLGYFGFVLNETESLLAQYNGTEWIFTDLNSLPQLPQVLEVGDTLTYGWVTDLNNEYIIQPSDRLTENYYLGSDNDGKVILDGEITFPEGSTVRFFSSTDGAQYGFNLNFVNGVTVYCNSKNVSEETIYVNPSDYCILKHAGGGVWFLTILSRAEQSFEIQITQNGTDDPQITTGSLKGTRGAAITTARISDGDYTISASTDIFKDLKDYIKSGQLFVFPVRDSGGNTYNWTWNYVDDFTLRVTSSADAIFEVLTDGIFATCPAYIKAEYKQ